MTHKINTIEKIFSFKNTLIAVVLMLIAFFAYSNYAQMKKDQKPVEITLDSSDHTIGKADAKVSVIEFADMQCPACKAFDPIVSGVMAEYIAKGASVKFTFKHFPLIQIHQNTMLAAIGSEAAARQGKFWEYKKVIYEKQAEWEGALDAKDKIKSYLPALGINSAQWEKDLSDPALETVVMNSLKEATSINLGGTPSFVINGVKVDAGKISTPEKMKAYIDAELAK